MCYYKKRNKIEAVAKDVRFSYIKAIAEQCLKAQIVFDKFPIGI
ncbi:MAG: transposase [Candidatus Cloacimonetes bacterium]|nr:transposase [Candidatus Cloacimonadota bacterium]